MHCRLCVFKMSSYLIGIIFVIRVEIIQTEIMMEIVSNGPTRAILVYENRLEPHNMSKRVMQFCLCLYKQMALLVVCINNIL